MVDHRNEEIEINRIRARLASLDAERAELAASLAEIERRMAGAQAISACSILAAKTSTVTTASPTSDKVALFRRLFAGRSDVFPLRWENAKTGKAGYAPACANEWIRGVCGKPQVKCGECPHQAFIPVTDEIIDKHLRGGDGSRAFVAGVYPMLPDETCWFLAADFDKESWAADAVGNGRNLPGERRVPPPSNAPDPATAAMSGSSFRSRSRRAPPASSAPRS